jgi:hypothetical protein
MQLSHDRARSVMSYQLPAAIRKYACDFGFFTSIQLLHRPGL